VRAAFEAALRCPACGGELSHGHAGTRRDATLTSRCGAAYPIRDGLPLLIHPAKLMPSDEEFRDKYDATAAAYDEGLDWLFASFGEDRAKVRDQLAEMLELKAGDRVLEIGAGTGEDSMRILDRIGSHGQLVAQDISSGMLELARRKLSYAGEKVDFLVSNAAYLPLADATFDAVFHFGGINEFGDVRRSLAEMARVVRPGGKVVVGDEGVAPWLRRTRYGRILVNANPLYRHRPPLQCIPVAAREVSMRWLLGNAFYVIDFRVAVGPPFLDLDLPIPGRRGGTLRSRYEQRQADRA
jgi:ubiquinone/menaquinone biosynthesis C-methylase UbiE